VVAQGRTGKPDGAPLALRDKGLAAVANPTSAGLDEKTKVAAATGIVKHCDDVGNEQAIGLEADRLEPIAAVGRQRQNQHHSSNDYHEPEDTQHDADNRSRARAGFRPRRGPVPPRSACIEAALLRRRSI